VRKAITFYLAAARFAKVELSPHFSAPRASSGPTGKRRQRSAKATTSPAQSGTDTMTDLRTKYVETLLEKFAAANGEVDPDLANRIERLVGFDPPRKEETF
jgi:hypothetical protein